MISKPTPQQIVESWFAPKHSTISFRVICCIICIGSGLQVVCGAVLYQLTVLLRELRLQHERCPLDTQHWCRYFGDGHIPGGGMQRIFQNSNLPGTPSFVLTILPIPPARTLGTGLGQRIRRRDSRARASGNQHHRRGIRLQFHGQQGTSRIPRRRPPGLAILPIRDVRLYVGRCGAGGSGSHRPGAAAVAVFATTLTTITAAVACAHTVLFNPKVQTKDDDYPRTAISTRRRFRRDRGR